MRDGFWRARPWLTAAVLVAVCSALLAVWMYRTEVTAQNRLFASQASTLHQDLEDQYRHLLTVVESTRGLFTASEEVTREELVAFFRNLDSSALGETAALLVHRPGEADLALARGAYLREAPELDPAVLARTRMTGVTQIGPPIELDHVRWGPSVAYTLSRALRNDPPDHRVVVTVVFFPQDLLEAAFEPEDEILTAALLDPVDGSASTVAEAGHPVAWMVDRSPVELPGRTWELVITPGPAFPVGTGNAPLVILGIGLVLAAMMVRAEALERSRARLRLVEERLALAEELNRAKDDFLATVSHEIRTPLASIQGFAALLQEGEVDPHEQNEVLGIVLDQAQELANLVEDLLVDARAAAGILTVEARPCRVADEVHTVLRGLSPGPVQLDLPDDLGVMADPVRLRQILRNLIRNAFLYGGDRLRVIGDREGAAVRICVEDDGPGIPEDRVERLFDRYSRGPEGSGSGVGIGLHLSRTLAELMGGSLSHRRSGSWTSFVLSLPTAPVENEPITSPRAGEAPVGA